MTKGEMVEQVYLKVTGGRPDADVSVMREDIENLVGYAIASALDNDRELKKRSARADSRVFGNHSYTSYAGEFVATYEVTPEKDEARGLYKITPPVKYATFGENQGLYDLRPIKGSSYARASSAKVLAGMRDDLGITFYWPEIVNGGQVVYISDIGLPVCSHLLQIVVDAKDLNDDDEIPAPANVQFNAINLLVQFFMEQRSIPEDTDMTDEDTVNNNRQVRS